MHKGESKIKRRSVLKGVSAVTAGAALGFPYYVPSGVRAQAGKPGANDKITVAHIGVGGMGGYHLREMVTRIKEMKQPLQIAAVCDVDEKHLQEASKVAGPQADTYRDYRYILERKDVDAVVIATPDHWHAVQMVHAAECGKHVYVEKPACCTIEEGKAMVAAAQKNKIAVQVGSQGRSTPEGYLAHRYLVNGNIGHISQVDCYHYASPVDGEGAPDSEPPAELDYDFWLGPLRWRPYNKNCCHGNFRWMMESGGGQLRDRGAHVMSCAMYWMGADGTGPVTVEATGKAPDKGAWDAAVDMKIVYTFKNPDWVMTWTQHDGAMPEPPAGERKEGEDPISRPGYGAVYRGSKGTFTHWGGDGGTWAERKAREWQLPAGGKDVYKSPGHKEDWFEGIRTGKKTVMNIEAAVGVANLCVLGNLAFLLGRKLEWNQAKQEIVNDEQARRMMSRPQRYPYHL
ncbi:MAG: Gfo/Idh/MocA family oxidoreductase [Phycisphaerae bacterium]|nr:Gfo/Idh/MocA family oxidoreductase [Phycisphaerae bacterium]